MNSNEYIKSRAGEIAGEFTQVELLSLVAELRLIHQARIVKRARYYKQPEPTPVPMGRPPLQFVTSSVSVVTFDGVRTESCD